MIKLTRNFREWLFANYPSIFISVTIKYAGEYIRKTFDDYGKAIAKGFKGSINKDFNEKIVKAGADK